MAATKVKAPAGQKAGKGGNKFFIDFTGPANDGILDASAFEKYLHDHIKVDNKAGQLGDAIKVTKEGEYMVEASGGFRIQE
jgi:large subunit ribosomal protein L22e